MVFTVLLAIWGTTTKGMAKGSSIFTKDNALFWGLAFGFGYAGSITMVANVLGDVKDVLMAGHAITWLTLLVLHRFALRKFIYSENLLSKDGTETRSDGKASDGSTSQGNGDSSADESGDAADMVDSTTTDGGVEVVGAGKGDKTEADGSAIGDDSEVDWSADIPPPIESNDDWQLDDDDSEENVDDGLGDVDDEVDDEELDDDELELLD
jgi:hypothetical protein